MDIEATVAPLLDSPERAAILCDIDGTLAPIVERAADARVPDDTRDLMARLAARYRLVACLSGRPALAARRLVGVDELTYVGNHGYEILEPGAAQPHVVPEAASGREPVRDFAAGMDREELAQLGIRGEDKDTIWSYHWRGAADESAAQAKLELVAERAREQGLVTHWGRKVLEIRPDVEIDKGTSIRHLVGGGGIDSALFAGDDVTDLDGFRELRDLVADGTLISAVCVGVRSDEGPEEIVSEADLVVDGPDGFRSVLEALSA